ncbi:hypothetical protein HK103_003653 [Boothiomyces macroporosus]|uniref:PNPLA domain-containing protein n=1 Tax=Boothiomyces macroporosus TaxID=261099 RepID=A0AAD5UK29_9FUNG|nr:hypothetical protein HK103_003653 [Boothiomyces macroporosus]
MKRKNKKQRKRASEYPMGKPNSDYTDTESTTTLENHLPHKISSVYKQKKKASSSLTFYIVQYPILFFSIGMMIFNLVCYTVARFCVMIAEFVIDGLSRHRKLRLKLKEATTYGEWLDIAKRLDEKMGLNKWRNEPNEEYAFDEELLITMSSRMKNGLQNSDLNSLCNILQYEVCKQDFAGIEHELLYSRCFSGTKHSIEEYLSLVDRSLDFVAESSQLSKNEKYAIFKQISMTYGRTALCLSGGATLTYFHLGVIKSLLDEKLLPNIVSGTSAGSLMAAMVAVRTDEEIRSEVFVPDFVDHVRCCHVPLQTRLKNFYNRGALFDEELFRQEALWFCKGNMTFLEAFKKTGRVLNISVVSNESHSKLKVLNHINAPQVTIASAVVASSAVPFVLPPCELKMKDELGNIVPYYSAGKLWRDGSLVSDIPEKELNQSFRVKYIIVSQVNPHISLFFFSPKGSAGCPPMQRSGRGWRGGFIASSIVQYFLLDLHKWLTFLRDMDLMPKIMDSNVSNIWLQSFAGNVTILPPNPTIGDLTRLVTDPDKDRLDKFLADGQLYTWPKIAMIANRYKNEKKILQLLDRFKN